MNAIHPARTETYPGRVFEAEVRRFWEADRLHAEGLELMRQNLRRRHPDATAAEVEEQLRVWLLDRPADAPGVVRATGAAES